MQEKKPFNDGSDYLQKHIGVPDNIKINKLPRFIKWIGCFMLLFLVLFLIIGFIVFFY